MSTVLLVEDSPTQALEIRLILEGRGHQVQLAANGVEALARLRQDLPDVVVTDLEMPDMNGMELVDQLQAEFPQLPSILVTARGSETLAVQALRNGASAYVPKSLLSTLLPATIRDVLGVLQADQNYARLIDTLISNDFRFRLPSDPFLIAPLVDLVVQMIAGMRLLRKSELIQFSSSLGHAIMFGMLHGNLELNAAAVVDLRECLATGQEAPSVSERRADAVFGDRRLTVEVSVSDPEIRCRIVDQGRGFDRDLLLGDAERAIFHEDGHGVGMITSFMDVTELDDSGHALTLIKRTACRDRVT